VELSDEDLGTASTRMVADPDDADGLAVVWQSRVFLLDSGGVLSNLGRRLAEEVRMPGALVVDLDAVAVRRLRCRERLVAFGLPHLLGRLVGAGLVRRVRPAGHGGLGSYQLTVPELHLSDVDDMGGQ
jgi:hypothetical protein